MAATLAVTLGLVGTIATPARAADVAILLPTVLPLGFPAGSGSVEALAAASIGATVVIIPPGGWAAALASSSPHKVYVLGDPHCNSANSTVPIAVAEIPANASALATKVTGNVVIIGTDPTAHHASGGVQLWKLAIQYALAGFATHGAGAVISLSCYYHGTAPTPTPVPVLSGFGPFMTQQANTSAVCANSVTVVNTALTLPLGPSPLLSGWNCSVHEGFVSTSWPVAGFMPLAVATDPSLPGSLLNFVAADGTKGFPYILVRSGTATPAQGILKVCKVAGLGVAVGTSFSFTAGTSTFTVPAGPAPGGYCVVGPTFPVGTNVTVDEAVPPGHVVSSIVVAPPGQIVGTPNLPAGSVNIMIGSGVTEVTFTDKRTGFLEICKRGPVGGNFAFTVNPGALGPFVVPAQACSPAIEVAAGSVVIHEMPTPGIAMIGCATIPPGNQLACNIGAQNSTVNVVPGNVSTMTIAFVTNAQHHIPTDGAATTGHTHATGITLACAPNPAPLREPVTCTAKVTAVEPKTGTPTGAISFVEGSTTLAAVQLSSDDGTAAFTTMRLAAGIHAIVAFYSGDATFEKSASQQFNITVGQP